MLSIRTRNLFVSLKDLRGFSVSAGRVTKYVQLELDDDN